MRAQEWRSKKDLEKTRADLKSALKLDPNRIEALLLLGEIAQHSKSDKEALNYYRRVLETDPEDGQVPYRIWELLKPEGRRAMSREGYEESKREFRTLMDLYPKNRYIRFYTAKAEIGMGNRNEAENLLVGLIKADPGLVAAHNLLLHEVFENDPNRVYATYSRLIDELPDSSQVHTAFAFSCTHGNQQDAECAIEHHRIATRLDDQNGRFRVNLAGALAEAGRHEEAIDEYRRARKLTSDAEGRLQIGFALGQSLAEVGRHKEAIESLREAERYNLMIRPNEDPAIMLALARSYFNIREFELAQAYYQLFDSRFGGPPQPAYYPYYVQMGKAYEQRGAYPSALIAFEKAESSIHSEEDPRKHIARFLVGESLYREKRLAESRQKLKAAGLGTERVSSESIEALSDEDRNVFKEVAFRASLLFGEVTGAIGHTDEALEAVERAARRADSDTERLLVERTRGRILLDRNDSSSAIQALEHFRNAINIDPDNASTKADESRALMQLGRYEEARKILDDLKAMEERERPKLGQADLQRLLAQVDVAEARQSASNGVQGTEALLAKARDRLRQIPDNPEVLDVRKDIQDVEAELHAQRLEGETELLKTLLYLLMFLVVSIILIGVYKVYFMPRLRNAKLRERILALEEQMREFIRRVKGVPGSLTFEQLLGELKHSPIDARYGELIAERMTSRKARGRDILSNIDLGDLEGILLDVLRDDFCGALEARNAPSDLKINLRYLLACKNMMAWSTLGAADADLIDAKLEEATKVFA
ncbi:tetratricopeptide repeat protein [Candidatus Thiosymbion oneisti]|uniref:tetratricopeptide repeat protein n=1 Tax=Candidatus Thiosymbion oneisti TaxID=589554 RepID=UPI0013FD8DF4|nr:tetratricopeptide repeat protein [Candidatus Thiosymbion oneisti]